MLKDNNEERENSNDLSTVTEFKEQIRPKISDHYVNRSL